MSKRAWIWITVACGVLFIALVGGMILMVANLSSSGAGGTASYDWQANVVRKGGKDRILQLNVNGVIMSGVTGGALGPAATSSDEIRNKLDQAMRDDTVKGIVVRVDSPGGDVVASDEIYRKLLQVKEKKGLPIVFSFGSTAASGGYYIATAGDKIVSNPLTVTGSIGVIMTSYNFSELADKVGVQEVIIKSGDLKDMGSSMRAMTEEEREVLKTMVGESYDRFVEVIATGRGIAEDDVRALADGRIYTGQQALELQLVDEMGTFEDAVAETEKLAGITNATIINYEKPFNLSSLFSMASEKLTGSGPSVSLVDLLEMKPPGLMYLYTTD